MAAYSEWWNQRKRYDTCVYNIMPYLLAHSDTGQPILKLVDPFKTWSTNFEIGRPIPELVNPDIMLR